MRTVKQIKNFTAAIFRYLLTFFFSFYTRQLFIDALGIEYLGVAGLMGNVLGMLAIAELGIGSSIIFSLYKPLAEKDQHKVHLLIELYRKLYRYIALFVLVIGLALLPFLTDISPDLVNIPHYRIIYLMFLANSVIPYFFAYNSTLYTATQQDYKLQNIRSLFYILTMGVTIAVLLWFPDYILLTACTMLLGILSQLLIYYMAHRKWPWLRNKVEGALSSDDIFTIKKNVKAMVMHKIGSYCIYGTSSLIIANCINLVAVGLYANYQSIVTITSQILQQFYSSANAGMGELIASGSKDQTYRVFREMNFLSCWMYGQLALGIYFVADAFITIWLGTEYIISPWAVLFIALNIYVTGLRMPCATFKSAAGIFSSDQYIPIIQAVVNLILGFFLATIWGIPGVTLAVLLSGLLTISWYGAYVIYRDFFHISFIHYMLDYLIYTIFVFIASSLIFMVKELYTPENPILCFLYLCSLVILAYHALLVIVFRFLPGSEDTKMRCKTIIAILLEKIRH